MIWLYDNILTPQDCEYSKDDLETYECDRTPFLCVLHHLLTCSLTDLLICVSRMYGVNISILSLFLFQRIQHTKIIWDVTISILLGYLLDDVCICNMSILYYCRQN